MAFGAYGVEQKDGNANNGDKVNVNFDELNEYVVKTAQLEQPETLIGYVAGIYDLGMQDMPDSEVVFAGSEEEEAEIITQYPSTYFKNGTDPQTKKPVRLKCWPNKPQQCITMAIDFPDIIVDKGQFFGESKPMPLRLYLGGQFYIENAGMVVARPTPLRIRKNKDGKWSFDSKHLLHKMAVGCKLINADGVFLPQQIDELLGKPFQFSAQVFFKESKGKKYYTENIKFVGGLGRGQVAPELTTTPFVVQFDGKNPEESIKELRAHIVNTIKRANNYASSGIKKQIDALRYNKEADKEQKEDDVPEAPKKQPKAKAAPVSSMDDDIPFAPIGLQNKLSIHWM